MFSNPENDPVSRKNFDIVRVSKLRWILERRNIFFIDNKGFTVKAREAIHNFNGLKIEDSFIDCLSIGKASLDRLVSLVVECKPLGSIEFLRKQLNLKKILPTKVQKKSGKGIKHPFLKLRRSHFHLILVKMKFPSQVFPC